MEQELSVSKDAAVLKIIFSLSLIRVTIMSAEFISFPNRGSHE